MGILAQQLSVLQFDRPLRFTLVDVQGMSNHQSRVTQSGYTPGQLPAILRSRFARSLMYQGGYRGETTTTTLPHERTLERKTADDAIGLSLTSRM